MERARYDGLAEWFDTEFQPAPLEGPTWDAVGRLLPGARGRLLDVGCGTGRYSVALAELGWTVTGVDISEDMLRRARERGVDAVRADAATLPFAAESFDAAVSLWTHTDVEELARVLGEIARELLDVGVRPE